MHPSGFTNLSLIMKNRHLPFVLTFFVFAQFVLIAQDTWEPRGDGIIPTGFEQYEISDIFIVSDDLIWAMLTDWSQIGNPIPESQRPLVIKSTDGGESWEVIEVEEAAGRSSWNIYAFDEDTAWITTQSYQPTDTGRGLFRTTDGGVTWTEKLNHSAGAGWIHFFDDQNAVCYNIGIVKVTTNEGENWETVMNIPPNGNGSAYSVATSYSIVGDTIWSGTGQGKVFRSVDKGHNWEEFDTGVADNIPSIAFANADTGILVNNDGDLWRSTDGGETWNPWSVPPGIYELTRIEGTRILVATSYEYPGFGGTNQTLYTDDLGETWVMLDNSVRAYVPVFTLKDGEVDDRLSNWHGWIGAIRLDTTAPTLHRFNMVSAVGDLLAKSEQVRLFPNPVMDQLTIQAEDLTFESVRIFDAQGQILTVQPVSASTTFSMDVSHLSSGVYILEIRTESGFIIKKVVKR